MPALDLYEVALTHRSYAFEQPGGAPHNERLEFLGDAILEAVVTDLIYRTHPELAEGDMAKLRASVVNTQALARLARCLDLGPHIRLGKGEEATGGRDKDHILADTLEAVVGAVYLDRGIEVVREHLVPLFTPLIEEQLSSGERHDAKTALQEIAVRDHGGLPEYRVAASGPDHDKRFTAVVYLGSQAFGEGSGRSKKEAEQNAARQALQRLVVEDEQDQGDARARAG